MPSSDSSVTEKYRILLRVSEAANQQLEFAGILESVAEVLCPFVAFDLISVVTVENGLGRPLALHVPGFARRTGEPWIETLTRALDLPKESTRDAFRLEGSALEHVGRTNKAYVAVDLARERRFPDDEFFLEFGFRTYVRTPLFVRNRLIGSLCFSRREPAPFQPEEVALLEDMSRPIATAVSNSLAYDEIRRLKDRVAAENVALREEIDRDSMFEEIVGSSPALRPVLARIDRVAPTTSTVLITGETGTGKELIARAIHRRSPRGARALIKVNCAALPESLIASELFGHEKGAFTGAIAQRLGRFELASGGSIFLDEVSELPMEVQVALLRVLQEGELERVGGARTIRTDARVIAASNRDLELAISEGLFRQDLFYRLNVFPIHMPPLRERREDIPVLAEYFVQRYSARLGKRVTRIDRGAMDYLISYEWPGNVRELQNIIERAVVLADHEVLHVDEEELRPPRREERIASLPLSELREEEKRRVEQALAEARGRVAGPAGAAARLGVPNTTLESKIKRYGIDKHRFRVRGSS